MSDPILSIIPVLTHFILETTLEKGTIIIIPLVENLRHKGTRKVAQVHMARKGQRWDLNLCSHHIMPEVGSTNKLVHGKVL